MGTISNKIFCAFCRLERKIVVKHRLDWTNVVLASCASVFLTYMTWQEMNPRGVIYFVISLIISEIFINLRWRMSMPCPHCGFDPLLYKTNRELAAARVKSKLDQLKSTGQHLLKQNNPFLSLPRREIERTKPAQSSPAARSSGRILSREV